MDQTALLDGVSELHATIQVCTGYLGRTSGPKPESLNNLVRKTKHKIDVLLPDKKFLVNTMTPVQLSLGHYSCFMEYRLAGVINITH